MLVNRLVKSLRTLLAVPVDTFVDDAAARPRLESSDVVRPLGKIPTLARKNPQ